MDSPILGERRVYCPGGIWVQNSTSFEAVNDQSISQLIRSAQRRVLLVVPAVSQEIAMAIEDRWRALGADAVSVVTDLSDIPYRLGFGEAEGLKVLKDAAKSAQAVIQVEEGVRIGLVLADDTLLLFTPTAQALESQPDPRSGSAHNGLLFASEGSAMGQAVEKAAIEIGRRTADDFSIRRVEKALEQNPPKQFEVSRVEWVFNSIIEFVELELKGVEVQRRKASLPPDLLNLIPEASSRHLLSASFHLLDKDDLTGDPEAKGFDEIRQEKQKIAEQYLEVLPHYGTVIRRAGKKAFLEAIEAFKNQIEGFRVKQLKILDSKMAANRKKLVDVLLPGVQKAPPARWAKYGPALDEGKVRRLLEVELADAFGTADHLLGNIRVDVRFKGVTYEMLKDPKFQETARRKLPDLDTLLEEHEAARVRSEPQGSLFGEPSGDEK